MRMAHLHTFLSAGLPHRGAPRHRDLAERDQGRARAWRRHARRRRANSVHAGRVGRPALVDHVPARDGYACYERERLLLISILNLVYTTRLII